MAINWSLLGNQQGQFQNALAMGAQMGAAAAERKNQEGYRNALMNYDPSNPDSWKDVARYDMKAGMDLRNETRQAQAAAERADLQRRAFAGDTAAQENLAGLDLDAARALRTDQKQAVALQAKQRGEAALLAADKVRNGDIAGARAIITDYAQRMGDNEAAGILEMDPQQFSSALNTAIIEAEKVDALFQRLDPNYRVVGQGEVLVDVTNPAAVNQFGGGGQSQFQEGQTATNPQTGRRVVFRNGNWVPLREGQ